VNDASDYLFLASAVAGRRVAVHCAREREALAYSDGQSIYLPADGGAGWDAVIAQASLIAAGSLAPACMRRLIGRGAAARRYAFLEVLRARRLLDTRLPNAFLDLLAWRGQAPRSASAEASLDWALSARPLPEAPACVGTVRPLLCLRSTLSEDGWRALTQRQARGDVERRPIRELDDEDSPEESRILRLFQNPFGGASALAKLLNEILGAGVAKGAQEPGTSSGGETEMPVGRVLRALRRGAQALRAQLPIELPDIDAQTESAALRYPEWDVHAQAYRKDWTVVEEVEAWRPDGARALDAVLKPASRELRRQLGSLGLDHELHRRQTEGTDLDSGRLIDCAIDLASGHSPAALDVYRASRRTRRDLAVMVMLDISGSTGEQDGSGRSVFDHQIQAAWQLGRSLNDLGDAVAVMGFHSWGRNLVRAVRLKGAEERWSARVSERFAQLEPVGYTRTGAAIRHGERALRSGMRLPNRLLILITDGIAYDQDYEAHYAEADARKALEEARSSGTACVCLCIGGSVEAEKLRAVFGAANLLIVDEPDEITPRIRQTCRRALAAVSQRKLRRAVNEH